MRCLPLSRGVPNSFYSLIMMFSANLDTLQHWIRSIPIASALSFLCVKGTGKGRPCWCTQGNFDLSLWCEASAKQMHWMALSRPKTYMSQLKLKEFPPSSEDSGPEFHGNPPKFGWLVETPKKNGPKRHLLHRAVQGSGYLAPLGSVAQVASNCWTPKRRLSKWGMGPQLWQNSWGE